MRSNTEKYLSIRNYLIENAENYDKVRSEFKWPQFDTFNFVTDWFDYLADHPDFAQSEALVICEEDGTSCRRTYKDLAERSRQLARWLTDQGVKRGDRMMLMLNNQVELWEFLLACVRAGIVINPATVMLGDVDLQHRVEDAKISWVVANDRDAAKFDNVAGDFTVIQIQDGKPHQTAHPTLFYSDSHNAEAEFELSEPTRADELSFIYFTSGTTSRPKLVQHTHTSYAVGHLTTVFWLGLKPHQVQLAIGAPGWAMHVYANFFGTWIVGGTVLIYNYTRFNPKALMAIMDEEGVDSFWAPPTVWRMLVHSDLSSLKNPPAQLIGGGEPLNPELLNTVKRGWGQEIRDGFGQTETTGLITNTPGQLIKPASMGRPMPGVEIVLKDPVSGEIGDTGEICVKMDPRPVNVTVGYENAPDKNAEIFRDGYYHTGDIARKDKDGYFFYIGRADDVFKASDYRVSPFELESVAIEHPAVAEVAVVPSPDPLRLVVPKAYIGLAPNWEPTAETAESILKYCRENLAPYKRIRRVEFCEMPKTVSGKIRRVALREREQKIHAQEGAEAKEGSIEYSEEDFPNLKG
ncbi:AMP-binding protein [Corynebacterium poyangense]|uniref:AMP-binding protein n=1 Tax=Corynebacterium poyangense TaxID=2684405 RepID=A0A7H0SR94_9CORY|nr:AMP-binding protein [Corynebacterium poyangense]QNQ91069.1 AMP-binding protein [Corynebacterium poyangense]